VYHVRRGGEEIQFYSNTESNFGEKVFEEDRIYRSGIIGLGVRLRLDLAFEVGRILQAELPDYLKPVLTMA